MAADNSHSEGTPASTSGEPAVLRGSAQMLATFNDLVTERFHRLTALDVVAGLVDISPSISGEALPPAPCHPLCSDPADGVCREDSWRSLLAELALRPEVYWHDCRHERFCASVPVLWHRHCLAVCRLVCPKSTGREHFEHCVELLDVLCENFVARHAESWLGCVPVAAPGVKSPSRSDGLSSGTNRPRLHAKVREAVEYIDEHFTDPEVNAGGIARMLHVNTTYLAHLFAEQVGTRMSRYITDRRVDLAKKLLAGTTWQVKRIARETGYASPDWFSHVFHAHSGLKPGEYRRQVGEQKATAAY